MSNSRHAEAADDQGAEATGGRKKGGKLGNGLSKHTICAWKGGMNVGHALEAKQLRNENTRLRKLVADLSLDNEALQSVIRKKVGARNAEGSYRADASRVCLQRAEPAA